MPNYCALEDAFPMPEWVEKPSYHKQISYQDSIQDSDQRYGQCSIPVSAIPEQRGISSRDNGSLWNQDEYSLYKVLQNKYGHILPSSVFSSDSSSDSSSGSSSASPEAFSMSSFSSFAANDFDRLLIILLAGFLLLTIIDYGKRGLVGLGGLGGQ